MSAKIEDADEDALDILPTNEIAWPEAEFELNLRKPVEHKEETYAVLQLREPTGGEWEQIFANPAQTRRRFAVSLIGGIPMAAAAKIGIGDLVRGEAYLNSFFEVGQAIGER